MSVGYKVIKVDSPWKETDVTVFDGDIVPIVTANILASTIGLKGFLEKKSPKDLIDGDGIYKSKNGKIVKCLCTLEGILLFIILIFSFYKNIPSIKLGYISCCFLILYSIFRFLIEFLREPDQHIGLFFNLLTMGQLLSIPIFILGLIIIIHKK